MHLCEKLLLLPFKVEAKDNFTILLNIKIPQLLLLIENDPLNVPNIVVITPLTH